MLVEGEAADSAQVAYERLGGCVVEMDELAAVVTLEVQVLPAVCIAEVLIGRMTGLRVGDASDSGR